MNIDGNTNSEDPGGYFCTNFTYMSAGVRHVICVVVVIVSCIELELGVVQVVGAWVP